MPVEQRIRTTQPAHVAAHDAAGLPIRKRRLGRMVDDETTAAGPLNPLIPMSAHESFEERARRRATPFGEHEGWLDCLKTVRPAIVPQESRPPLPAPFLPVKWQD